MTVERLDGEEGANPFDDFVCSGAYSAQRPGDQGTWQWRSLIERYIEEGAGIHVHFWIDTGSDPNPNKHCAIFEWPRSAEFHGLSRRDVRKLDNAAVKRSASQMERAVLVEVGEFVKLPQGALGVLPCRKRLQRLDECSAVGFHAPEKFGGAALLVVEFPFLEEDWKAIPLVGLRPVLLDKFPNQIVQGTSQVVNVLSDDDAPHRRALLANTQPEYQLPVFGIELTRNEVRLSVQKGLNRVAITYLRNLPPVAQDGKDDQGDGEANYRGGLCR